MFCEKLASCFERLEVSFDLRKSNDSCDATTQFCREVGLVNCSPVGIGWIGSDQADSGVW